MDDDLIWQDELMAGKKWKKESEEEGHFDDNEEVEELNFDDRLMVKNDHNPRMG